MSQNAMVKALKMLVQNNQEQQDKFTFTTQQVQNQKRRCTFRPGNQVTNQLNQFNLLVKKGEWNGEISIKDYKGTFKVEHWIYIEQELRSLTQLQLLQFINTQLDKEHLNILGRLINWLNPIDFTLILKQNEIDDMDVKDFLYDLLLNKINFQQIFIKSNPGIYKGSFIVQLEQFLKIEYETKKRNYFYKIIKNTQTFSLGLIKIFYNELDQPSYKEKIENAELEIDQTCFYDLKVAGCFTNNNYKAFYNLIQLLYHEDHLEQLVGLNVNDNYLGELGEFSKACQLFSTSKGLLLLEMSNQPLLHNSVSVESLCGNRYDQLRLSMLNIANNDKMTPKVFELISYNILNDLKIIKLDNSLPADLPTLLKIFYFIESYDKQITHLKQLTQQTKTLQKLNLEELDLSTVENYNRHDLMYKLIKNTCFNIHSNLRKLTISNCDAGRMEAYYKAYDDFVKEIKANSNNFCYQNYRIPLVEIIIPEQRYSMETPINLQFLLSLVFTTSEDYLQIQSVTFIEAFNVSQRNEAFNQALKIISSQDENVRYTLKQFYGIRMRFYFEQTHFNQLVFNNNLSLEKYYLEDTSFSTDSDQFEESLTTYINDLQLNNQFFGLKSFTLKNAYGASIELYSLVQYLIFHKCTFLEELCLIGITITLKEKNKEILQDIMKNEQHSIKSLKILEIGNLYGEQVYENIFQLIILNTYIRLNKLTLIEIPITNFLESIIIKNINIDDPDHQLSQLNYLSIESIELPNANQWQLFVQTFLFNMNSQLATLKLKTIKFCENMQKAIQKVFENLVKKIEEQNQTIKPRLNSLTLQNCEIQTEFLIMFALNPFCKIKELSLNDCHGFDKYLMASKQIIQENDLKSTLTLSLNSFEAINTDLDEAFEWFFEDIVFNEAKQQLTKLVLRNCKCQKKHIQSLCKIITNLKNKEKSNNLKRYFKLRDIDLSLNPDISTKQWNYLFTNLLDVNKNNLMQSQINEQKEGENNNEGTQEVENKLQEIKTTIKNSNLNLSEKILFHYNKFQFQPPQQLRYLELDLNLTYSPEEQTQQIYRALVCGIICHPQNKLVKLKLSNFNIDMFMKNVEEFQKYGQQLSRQINVNETFNYELEEIIMEGIIDDNEEITKLFVSYFICSKYINLKKLNLSGFNNGIIKEIIQQSQQKDKYYINELKLIGIQEALNRDNSLKFFKYFIFGELFPIESLEIGEFLTFEGKITTNDWYGQNKYEKDILLKKLNIHSGGYDIDKIETISILINEILQNPKTQLDELIISGDEQECRCFDEFYAKGLKEIKQLHIKKLVIQNTMLIEENFLSLLNKSRNFLVNLQLQGISSYAETESILNEQINSQLNKDCSLQVKSLTGEDIQVLQEKFCYNKNFNFTRLTYCHLNSFNDQLNVGNGFEKLKYLQFSFDLYYNNFEQLSEESLRIIGEKFIYNEQSQLEELTFHQCHLKPPGIQALTESASQFRSDIEKRNKQSSTQLKLKRFNIYYSLYIGQEGAELINKEILFFEYISIERIELEVTNWSSEMQIDLCKQAINWLKFQKQFKRTYINYLPLKYFDIGRNEFVQTEEAWNLTCSTILFSNLTPFLEDVFLHFMALTDASTEIITKNARTYFASKPNRYVYQVKRLSFSHNGSLTHKGWLDVAQNLFFHPKVELLELNISDTNLDNDLKLQNIINSAIQKAKNSSNKKLSIHTLLTHNTVVKQKLQSYLSEQPEGYGPPPDQPIVIDYEMSDVGRFAGTPEEFGYFNQLQNNIMYNQKNFITANWTEQALIKVSQYHLSLATHYLSILNEHFIESRFQSASIYLNLNTLDQFCNYFKYTTKEPGCPYPFTLLFQNDTFLTFKQSNSIIQKIVIINAQAQGLEKVTHQFILYIWENIKSNQSSIDQIIMDYYLDDDLIDELFRLGYTEADIVQLIRLIPPSKIRIQNTLTLQAIKAIYSIFYDTTHFEYSSIQYDFDNFLNIGIGYALRELAYNMKPIGCRKIFKKFLYKICDAFVQQTKQYKFNNEVTNLNKFLSTKQIYFFFLVINNILFLAICLIAPYGFSHYYQGDSTASARHDYCINQPNQVAFYLYYSFAGVSLILEAYIYKNIIQHVPTFFEKLAIQIYPNEDSQIQQQKENDEKQKSVYQKQGSVLKSAQTQFDKFNNSSQAFWISFTKNIVTSQLAKYDQFNDICFILTCYYCDEYILFYLVLALQIFNQGLNVIGFFIQIFRTIFNRNIQIKQLSTQYINDFYRISLAGKNQAIALILDQVAPFNVDIIPNNFIMRFLMPNQAGKAINSSIKGYLIQFLFEDLPQIIILIIFLVKQAIKNGDLKWNIIITLLTSSLAVITSFYKFMSIRPTYLQQEHFDELSDKKILSKEDQALKDLNQEQNQIETYINLLKKTETALNVNESALLL
ncbi:unnamed protein product [Paramecium primaurelia]|uniref:Transmembrane protein n=1 Tax=Paramecium primaurelia TaxID=5886 RepID=A0A8S1JPJ8_PARPR|nr:unnamed protein product [Paramecium primaurelia]